MLRPLRAFERRTYSLSAPGSNIAGAFRARELAGSKFTNGIEVAVAHFTDDVFRLDERRAPQRHHLVAQLIFGIAGLSADLQRGRRSPASMKNRETAEDGTQAVTFQSTRQHGVADADGAPQRVACIVR